MIEQCRKKALEILEHPERYPTLPKRGICKIGLRLCHFPSFDPYKIWAVLEQVKTNKTYLRRIVWFQKSILPDPMTYGSEVEIHSNMYDKIVNELLSVKILPFVPTSILALDGEIFQIECGDHHCSSKLQWWCDAPSDWKKLEIWYHKTVSYFESLLPDCTADAD